MTSAVTANPEPKPKRKRKPKKIIPVGRNGLKKRRVEKSRTAIDAKGYMGRFFLALLGKAVVPSLLPFCTP